MDETTDGQVPSSNGSKGGGRDAQGRFVKGWKGGPGNPHAKQSAELRSALFGEATAEDMRAVTRKLIDMAKAGDLLAIKELLDRILGEPAQTILGDIEVTQQSVLTPEQESRACEIAERFDRCTCSAEPTETQHPRHKSPPHA